MLSVKGTFQNGVAQPSQPIDGHDGQLVIITFIDGNQPPLDAKQDESDWDALDKLVNDCEVEIGISDIAHNHDHYVHNKSKKD